MVKRTHRIHLRTSLLVVVANADSKQTCRVAADTLWIAVSLCTLDEERRKRMSNLENQPHWPEILRLKDKLPLKALASRFETTPGAISAALKRTGTARVASVSSDDDLPPEPGEDPEHQAAIDRARRSIRAGSKDSLIARHVDLLGRRPDADVAKLAGVSVRTIASFRARHGVPGYRGPRRPSANRGPRRSRIDPFAHLLGTVPDRVVAEKAGVSLNAVRNYRVNRGIPAAGRRGGAPAKAVEVQEAPLSMPAAAEPTAAPIAPAAAPLIQTHAGRSAWRITWRDAEGEQSAIVVANDLVHAAQQATAAKLPGEVVGLQLAGSLLDA
jgi:hypothetical protein